MCEYVVGGGVYVCVWMCVFPRNVILLTINQLHRIISLMIEQQHTFFLVCTPLWVLLLHRYFSSACYTFVSSVNRRLHR